jgi:hypothetical protein
MDCHDLSIVYEPVIDTPHNAGGNDRNYLVRCFLGDITLSMPTPTRVVGFVAGTVIGMNAGGGREEVAPIAMAIYSESRRGKGFIEGIGRRTAEVRFFKELRANGK